MPFKTSYNSAHGMPTINLSGVDTVQRVAIGTTIQGYDDLLGEATFIYLPGLAACVAGDIVTYDLNPGAASITRAVSGTAANTGLPVGVAVADTVAGTFGWFQVTGVAIAKAIAATAVGRAFVSATAGSLTSTAAAGLQLLGARISTAVGTPIAGNVYLTLSRPFVQGQIT